MPTSLEVGISPRRADVVNDRFAAACAAHLSAEHGIGIAKRDWLPRVKDKVALDLMRTLTATLDPNGILNPGRVL